ncbi:MAG: hypothetical protein ACI84O_000760 [Myxococcota bacterium]|jgi:hypothetical protein
MKNFLRLTTGGLILAGASFFAMSDSAIGYSTIGGDLNLGQRDFRVYDNFNGSSANNNSTANGNWPAFTGAELAIWKGGAEWNSRPHGDGSGDSTQGDVGSGGANFTFFWEGMANGIGGSNDNICSSLSGSSGGVLAYCETPINDGWRIRFYGDAWNWQDGPGSVNSGMDIQGVACHELGHALGLGHSTAGGSPTMNAYISGTGNVQRSLAADDIAGLKSIYATKSASMPWIDNVAISGNAVTITGGGFSASTNRVWLMNDLVDGSNNGGAHATVSDVPSASGTSMTFQLPATGWEDGSIAVKRTTGGTYGDLSETHPFDTGGGGGGTGNDTALLTASSFTPAAGSGMTFSWSAAPSSAPYIFVYSFVDNSPFFSAYNGFVGTGTTTAWGTGSLYRVVPMGATGRTVFMEVQFTSSGNVYDSNTIRLDVP